MPETAVGPVDNEAGLPVQRRHPMWEVIRAVMVNRVDRVVFSAVAAAAGFAYSVLLPFDYTQRISFMNWQYMGPRYITFTVLFALGLAWVLTLQVEAIRRIARDRASFVGRRGSGGLLGFGAAVVSLLPSFLCCSPIVPTVVGVLGLSAAARLQTTGRIQYFFATQQDWLLLGGLAIIGLSGLWSTRKLAKASCLTREACAATSEPIPAAFDSGVGAKESEGQHVHTH